MTLKLSNQKERSRNKLSKLKETIPEIREANEAKAS